MLALALVQVVSAQVLVVVRGSLPHCFSQLTIDRYWRPTTRRRRRPSTRNGPASLWSARLATSTEPRRLPTHPSSIRRWLPSDRWRLWRRRRWLPSSWWRLARIPLSHSGQHPLPNARHHTDFLRRLPQSKSSPRIEASKGYEGIMLSLQTVLLLLIPPMSPPVEISHAKAVGKLWAFEHVV